MTPAALYPLAAVRCPRVSLSENCSPGCSTVPETFFEATRRLVSRLGSELYPVENSETVSETSAFFASFVVKSGSTEAKVTSGSSLSPLITSVTTVVSSLALIPIPVSEGTTSGLQYLIVIPASLAGLPMYFLDLCYESCCDTCLQYVSSSELSAPNYRF